MTEQNTDIPEETATLSQADYEKLRDELLKSDTENQDTEESDEEKDDDEEEITPTDADKSGTDSDKDAGEKSESKDEGDLPKWVQQRLRREKRKTEREIAKREALEARLAALEQKTDTKPETAPAKEKPEIDMDTPIPEEDYEYDYPEKDDYDSEEAWLEDTDRWENNLPLKGGKKADAKDEKADTVKAEKPKTGPDLKEPDEKAAIRMLFDDVRDVIEDSDRIEDDTSDSFFELIERQQIGLTVEMLDWLAENDDADLVAAEFVRAPRVANRIFRRPKRSQPKLLNELVSKLKGKDASKKPVDKGNSKNEIPFVSALRASRTSLKKNVKLEDVKDFKDYENLRKAM